jgi:hypothetical protein
MQQTKNSLELQWGIEISTQKKKVPELPDEERHQHKGYFQMHIHVIFYTWKGTKTNKMAFRVERLGEESNYLPRFQQQYFLFLIQLWHFLKKKRKWDQGSQSSKSYRVKVLLRISKKTLVDMFINVKTYLIKLSMMGSSEMGLSEFTNHTKCISGSTRIWKK